MAGVSAGCCHASWQTGEGDFVIKAALTAGAASYHSGGVCWLGRGCDEHNNNNNNNKCDCSCGECDSVEHGSSYSISSTNGVRDCWAPAPSVWTHTVGYYCGCKGRKHPLIYMWPESLEFSFRIKPEVNVATTTD